MHETQCFIAKYCPDLKRFEPRNVGIILWSDGQIVSRFLGEKTDGSLRAPSSMPRHCRQAYRQWVIYWRIHLSRNEIRRRNGELVPKSSDKFIHALCEKSKEQFMLRYSNSLPTVLSGIELQEAADEFFHELVEYKPDSTGRPSTVDSEHLKDSCNFVFERSGVRDNPKFHPSFPAPCAINHAWQDFTFHYGIGNGKPDAVFHRVLISRASSVHDAAFMFQRSTSSPTLSLQKERCAAMFAATPEQKDDTTISNAISLLSEFAVPINVLDEADATLNSVREIAHHIEGQN